MVNGSLGESMCQPISAASAMLVQPTGSIWSRALRSEEKSLLRIHGLCLRAGHIEELSIEMASIFPEKIGISHVAGTMVVPVLVVPSVGIEPVDLGTDITRVLEEVPELGRRRRATREPASTADDGNRFIERVHFVLLDVIVTLKR